MPHNLVQTVARFNDSLIIIIKILGRRKLYSEQKTSMIMLKVLQKTLASNVEVMVRELRIKKGKRFEFLCSFEHDGREYLFNKSAIHLFAYQSDP